MIIKVFMIIKNFSGIFGFSAVHFLQHGFGSVIIISEITQLGVLHMNINRLWAVVNRDTNEILYSSFDYNRSKRAYDRLVCPVADENGIPTPNFGDLWNIGFIRYDINSSYRNDDHVRLSPFQKSLNDDFRAFMDLCLLKRTNKTQTTKDNKNA